MHCGSLLVDLQKTADPLLHLLLKPKMPIFYCVILWVLLAEWIIFTQKSQHTTKFSIYLLLFYAQKGFACMYVCNPHIVLIFCRALNPPELELWLVVSHCAECWELNMGGAFYHWEISPSPNTNLSLYIFNTLPTFIGSTPYLMNFFQ